MISNGKAEQSFDVICKGAEKLGKAPIWNGIDWKRLAKEKQRIAEPGKSVEIQGFEWFSKGRAGHSGVQPRKSKDVARLENKNKKEG